jgi:voltage-gated potassium channel
MYRPLYLRLLAAWLMVATSAQAEWWLQVSNDGIGTPASDSTLSMAVFNDRLYVGTADPGRLYSTDRSRAYPHEPYRWRWNAESLLREYLPFIGNYDVSSVASLDVLENRSGRWLYAVTRGVNRTNDVPFDLLLRSPSGTTWEAEDVRGMWSVSQTEVPGSMEAFDGHIYISLLPRFYASSTGHHARVLRDDGVETQALETESELGDGDVFFRTLQTFDGHLYAGTGGRNEDSRADRTAEIWRTADGSHWEKAGEIFSPTMSEIRSMEVFRGYLYVGTRNVPDAAAEATGPEIWRSSDGTDWQQVSTVGQFDHQRLYVDSLQAFDGFLYAGVGGGDSPGPFATIYRSEDGLIWEDVTPDELARDEHNLSVAALTVISERLVAATKDNVESGTEIWVLEPSLPLPMRPERLPDESDLLYTTVQFLAIFGRSLLQTAPIWLSLLLMVISLGLWLGRLEGWKPSESIFFALMTASTVGLGAFRPKGSVSRPLAVVIVVCGVTMIALLVGASVSGFSNLNREPPELPKHRMHIDSLSPG